eukprot:scaffold25727_cov142-Cylindrotheca_fusiformis.AAC.4
MPRQSIFLMDHSKRQHCSKTNHGNSVALTTYNSYPAVVSSKKAWDFGYCSCSWAPSSLVEYCRSNDGRNVCVLDLKIAWIRSSNKQQVRVLYQPFCNNNVCLDPSSPVVLIGRSAP